MRPGLRAASRFDADMDVLETYDGLRTPRTIAAQSDTGPGGWPYAERTGREPIAS